MEAFDLLIFYFADYTVVIYTAAVFGAGTDTQIKIRIQGIAGIIRERTLSGSFERGR